MVIQCQSIHPYKESNTKENIETPCPDGRGSPKEKYLFQIASPSLAFKGETWGVANRSTMAHTAGGVNFCGRSKRKKHSSASKFELAAGCKIPGL
jgi:hypothetical protein